MSSNPILWNEEKDLLVADGLIKSPTKEKREENKSQSANQKPMCKRKSQSAQKKGMPREER